MSFRAIEAQLLAARARLRYRQLRLAAWKRYGARAHKRGDARGIERARGRILVWLPLVIAASARVHELVKQLARVRPTTVVTGPCSTFGPPNERAEGVAYGGSSDRPGIAVNPGGGVHWNDRSATRLRGKTGHVFIGHHHALLRVIDKGPSASGPRGPRKIDVTGRGAQKMGIDPRNFPTDRTATVYFFD